MIGVTRSSSRLEGTQWSTFPATCVPCSIQYIISCYLFPTMCWRDPVLRRWAWSQDTFPGSSLVRLFARIAPRLFSTIHDSLTLFLVEHFKIHWRKCLVFVSHSFDSNMKRLTGFHPVWYRSDQKHCLLVQILQSRSFFINSYIQILSGWRESSIFEDNGSLTTTLVLPEWWLLWVVPKLSRLSTVMCKALFH